MAISKLATILSLLFVSSAVILSPSAAESVAAEREFDYFALALQWPGAYCSRTRHCCPKNGCCRSLPLTEFTIHGLWPDYNDGSWPSCCTGSDFDAKKISSLVPLLEKYWPSLSCSSPSLCHGGKGPFWAHEWEKHGTCSYPVIKDEYSYFSTVLDLYSKYNITRVLNNAGFFATNAERYPLGDIVSTIEKSVGASPLLVCRRGSVEELQLCFDKDFKPRDCRIASNSADDAPNLRSSCPKYISLPTYAPLVSVPEDVDATNTWGAKASILFSKIMESLEGIAAE